MRNDPFIQLKNQTGTESVFNIANTIGFTGAGTGAGSATSLVGTATTWAESNVAIGYTAYQTSDAQSATVSSITDTTHIVTTTLTGAATWASKNYLLPYVSRSLVEMEGYKYLSMQYGITAGAATTIYLKIYGSIREGCVVTTDTNWVDLSSLVLGSSSGVTVQPSTTATDIVVIDLPIVCLRYMFKAVIVNSNGTGANSIQVYARKFN